MNFGVQGDKEKRERQDDGRTLETNRFFIWFILPAPQLDQHNRFISVARHTGNTQVS